MRIKTILANPKQRKALMVRTIIATQAVEGIETTPEQAEAAYDRVQDEKRQRVESIEVPVQESATERARRVWRVSYDEKNRATYEGFCLCGCGEAPGERRFFASEACARLYSVKRASVSPLMDTDSIAERVVARRSLKQLTAERDARLARQEEVRQERSVRMRRTRARMVESGRVPHRKRVEVFLPIPIGTTVAYTCEGNGRTVAGLTAGELGTVTGYVQRGKPRYVVRFGKHEAMVVPARIAEHKGRTVPASRPPKNERLTKARKRK